MRQVDLAAALARKRLQDLHERLRAQPEEPSDAEIAFEVASLQALPRAFRPPSRPVEIDAKDASPPVRRPG